MLWINNDIDAARIKANALLIGHAETAPEMLRPLRLAPLAVGQSPTLGRALTVP